MEACRCPPWPGTVFLSPLSPPTALEGTFVIIPILQMKRLKLEIARNSPEGVSLENDWRELETQVHSAPWPSSMWTKTSLLPWAKTRNFRVFPAGSPHCIRIEPSDALQ